MPNRIPSPPSPRAASQPLSHTGDAAGAEAMRQAFRRHAAGVTIVTMSGQRGPVGFTATSVASLSERPPLLVLALSARSSIAPTLRAAETLVVHLLSRDQQDLATRFAVPGADRFGAPTRWRPLKTGEPLLLDAATWLRCQIRDRSTAGDHWLVIAEILESQVDPTAEPLVYHDGGYGTVLRSDDQPVGGGEKSRDGDLGIRGRSPAGS
jgi:flavin reductase (DIM6/NTAB) family NADH-FMN oxidoreductase RutF